ncbi:MAG: fibronectin type III domain-containing protein [Thermoplasmata archaeon]
MLKRVWIAVLICVLVTIPAMSMMATALPPGIPQNLNAKVSRTNITLTWEPPVESIVDGYYVYKNNTKIATLPSTTLTYVDSDITKGVSYRYDVSAYNTEGEGEPATIYVTAQYAPSAPQNLRSIVHTDVVVLKWELPADDGGAPIYSYRVYRDDTLLAVLTAGGDFETPPLCQYADTEIQAGAIYHYNVSAMNWVGVSPNATITVQTPGVPAKVQNLTAEINGTKVLLRWDNVTGATRYNIYRNSSFLVSVKDTTYIDMDVVPQTSYSYYVRAENEAGEGVQSDPITVKIGERSESTVVVNEIPLWLLLLLIVLLVCVGVLVVLYARKNKAGKTTMPQSQPQGPLPTQQDDRAIVESILRAVSLKPEGEEEEALVAKCTQECHTTPEMVRAKLGVLASAGTIDRYEIGNRKYYKAKK